MYIRATAAILYTNCNIFMDYEKILHTFECIDWLSDGSTATHTGYDSLKYNQTKITLIYNGTKN